MTRGGSIRAEGGLGLTLSFLLALSACGPHQGRSRAEGPYDPARDPVPSRGVSRSDPGDAHRTAQRDTAGSPAEPGEEPEEEFEGDDEPDDAFDEELPADAVLAPPHPFAALSDAELERRLTEAPTSLGSMSLGKPSAGLLFNAVPMPSGDEWTVVASAQTYGTDETIQYLQTAIRAVARAFPSTPRVAIGDISARGGGYLKPHLSHQAGRDVDLGYYYLDGERWYARATEKNLDAPRTWALIRALLTSTDVELILVDRSLQALLREEAYRAEDRGFVDALFRGSGAMPPMIRHAPGHATHLHIRFYNPVAQETGRRLYSALLRQKKIVVGPAFAMHVARKGDTLIELAKRYGTTVRAIRRANGLKSSKIQAKKSYRIPQTGRAPPAFSPRPIAIPPRRIPPARTTDAAHPAAKNAQREE